MITKEKSRQEYQARINRVMDYIEKHIDQPIDLTTLADVAHFSAFHFHRMFTFLVGETPNTFLLRIRVEKAAYLLKGYKELSISEVAYSCGFNNVSSFSRTFKKYFGVTAKYFRETEKGVFAKDGLFYSKNGQKNLGINAQFCSVEFKNLIIMNTQIEVKEMPEMKVIYCRHTGQFHLIYKAYEKLMKWAAPRNLLNFPETKSLTVYHDDPSVTEIEKVRQDACITVNEDIKVDGEIGKMTVEGGKYVVGHFEINETEFQKAWNTMCMWFTESGYQQGDGNTYELYYNDHTQHPEKKHILDICIPVKVL